MFRRISQRFVVLGFAALALSAIGIDRACGQRKGDLAKAPQPQAERQPAYWIGIACTDNEGLREHFQLGDRGIYVIQVVEGSPAEKAGLRVADIILSADNKDVSEVSQINDVVAAARDRRDVKLEILRKGKKQEVAVRPARRPKSQSPRRRARVFDRPLQGFQQVYPGIVWGNRQLPNLPENLEVTITKKGKSAVRIQVKRGDERWDIKESEIDKLPRDVQPHVKRMLPGQRAWIDGQLRFPKLAPGGWPQSYVAPGAVIRPNVQKQIDDLRKQVEQLRRAIEKRSP